MAKGAESKSLVTKKILEIFPNAFLYNNDKEIRIPLTEQGETIEIKVVLSCAKTPAAEPVPAPSEVAPPQISEEDRRKVQELMAKLGL